VMGKTFLQTTKVQSCHPCAVSTCERDTSRLHIYIHTDSSLPVRSAVSPSHANVIPPRAMDDDG
jgi:hypothetical protein